MSATQKTHFADDETLARISQLERELSDCRKECEEQARLNGMGSQREARLMAELAGARREIAALSAQPQPKPTSDELEKVIADFCENFECDGADGEDEPITDAQRKFARGVIDGLLADPAWDELWGRQIEEMVRQRMDAQPQQVNDATGKESKHGK